MRKVKYVILGAGTAGLTALSTISKETEDFVMINGGAYGTTCARVGCMPSKALIQSANVFHKRQYFDEFGVCGAEAVSVDVEAVLKRVRRLRDRFTGGVKSGTTEQLKKEQLISGYATFVGENTVEVNGEVIHAERIIIATGSRPIIPKPWQAFSDVLYTSDEMFELTTLPKRVAVIGLGIIGLELGQAMARLGAEVTGFELAKNIAGLSVPEVNETAIALMSKEFTMHLGEAAQLERTANGVLVKTSKASVEVDAILASLGRRPNIDKLGLEHAGIDLDERGMPQFNVHTTQIQDKPLFIAGDVNLFRPILHEASYEGKMAGLNAISYPQITAYKRKASIGIAFTDPDIGFFGQSYRDADKSNIETVTFNLERNNGRAIVMHEDHGLICLFADKTSKKLLGGEIIMPHAEHFTHLLNWAVEQEMTLAQLMRMPFYHPVLEEAIQAAIRSLYFALYSQAQQTAAPELTVM